MTAPETTDVKTPEANVPEMPVTVENLAVFPVMVVPLRVPVKSPQIPVIVLTLTLSPVTVAPEMY